MNYNPFKTAITRNKPSKPLEILLDKNLLHGSILDYGCGKGFDSTYLKTQNYEIYSYDKYNEEFHDDSLLDRKYDCVMCNYVFNVIADLQEHEETLNKLKSLSDNVFVSVRSDVKAINENWKYDDKSIGYWTPKNTFQRFYTNENKMIDKLFGEVEYIENNSSFKLFRLK